LIYLHDSLNFNLLLKINATNTLFHCQHEIQEAGDEGQRQYEDETLLQHRTHKGLTDAINNAIDLKKHKLNAPFNKYLSIANPANGEEFLSEVRLIRVHPFNSISMSALISSIGFKF
jgi:hypothetical protein